VAISTSPSYPVAGEAVTVSSDASGSLVSARSVEVTSVPSRSAIPTGLLLSPTDRYATGQLVTPLQVADLGLLATSFVPDVPGEYGVTVRLIREVPDRAGNMARSIVATDSGTVQVGVAMTLPIRTLAFGGADLSITVVGDTIRAASLGSHLDERSRVAALQTTVTDALDDLVGATVATACGVFLARVNDLRDEVEDHFAGTTWHGLADAENAPTRYAAQSQRDGIVLLNSIRDALVGHTIQLSDGTRYHTNDDTASQPIVSPATDMAGATVLLADVRERCYERHRIIGSGDTVQVHTNAGGDTTNALSAATLLDAAIVAYLDALVAASPTAPTGEVDGQVTAEAHGFRVAS
jgi:hypothetical protein